MNESVKKNLVRRMLKCPCHVKRMANTKWQREQMPRKRGGKGGKEDRKCDGRNALR